MKLIRIVLISSIVLIAYACAMLCIVQPWFFVLFVIAAIAVGKKAGRTCYTAFGTAAWASASELSNAEMLGSKKAGLVVGRMDVPRPKLRAIMGLMNPRVRSSIACEQFLALFKNSVEQPLVWLTNAVHVAIFAPTGVGKGVFCVITFLLTCEYSCVVLDLKDGELARITADARRKMGNRVILLDPYNRVTDTPDTLNPLLSIESNSRFAIDDSRETAAAMVDRKEEKGDGVHFLDNAEKGWCVRLAHKVWRGR